MAGRWGYAMQAAWLRAGHALGDLRWRFLPPTHAEMAAAYLFHISQAHAFVDGNKRVAPAAALAFLYLNGYGRGS